MVHMMGEEGQRAGVDMVIMMGEERTMVDKVLMM